MSSWDEEQKRNKIKCLKRSLIMPSLNPIFLSKKQKPVKFTVPNAVMIDTKEIKNSLTRKNPLLFLEYNNNIHVYIHSSILWKADIFNIKSTLPYTFNSELAPLKKKWIIWVKTIKTMKWKANKKQTVVKMIFPKI